VGREKIRRPTLFDRIQEGNIGLCGPLIVSPSVPTVGDAGSSILTKRNYQGGNESEI
jgi:hypothetical protein